jgi:hypothetical protein
MVEEEEEVYRMKETRRRKWRSIGDIDIFLNFTLSSKVK